MSTNIATSPPSASSFDVNDDTDNSNVNIDIVGARRMTTGDLIPSCVEIVTRYPSGATHHQWFYNDQGTPNTTQDRIKQSLFVEETLLEYVIAST